METQLRTQKHHSLATCGGGGGGWGRGKPVKELDEQLLQRKAFSQPHSATEHIALLFKIFLYLRCQTAKCQPEYSIFWNTKSDTLKEKKQ